MQLYEQIDKYVIKIYSFNPNIEKSIKYKKYILEKYKDMLGVALLKKEILKRDYPIDLLEEEIEYKTSSIEPYNNYLNSFNNDEALIRIFSYDNATYKMNISKYLCNIKESNIILPQELYLYELLNKNYLSYIDEDIQEQVRLFDIVNTNTFSYKYLLMFDELGIYSKYCNQIQEEVKNSKKILKYLR